MPKALGLIETRGLVAAIEAADAMVKTSNVTLIGKEVTRPALVTIKIVGDVAAVKAAVDAGAAAAKRVGELVSIHVIPQPDSQMVIMLPEIEDDETGIRRRAKIVEKPEPAPVEEKIEEAAPPPIVIIEKKETVEKKPPEIIVPKPKPEAPKKSPPEESLFTPTTDHLERLRREALGIKPVKEEPVKEKKPVKAGEKFSMVDLEKLNVHELRKQARATEGFPIQGRDISKANRRELLDYFKKLH